jgi:NADPH:quinone reductase-like Zn-dependent oxidoreductase
MRAALIREVGTAPEVVERDEPEAGLVVDVTAAPLNPVDLAIAAGTFYAGPPIILPYVPGVEGVGRTPGGARVWFETGAGFAGDGAMAERAAVDPSRAVELPADVDDALAGCLGVAGLAAWVPLAHRARVAEGETVLILGATGIVGQIGVQAAKLLGAGRVVAAGRDAERLAALDADAAVQLPATADALREAAGGPIDVVLDPLWGEHAATATEAMNVNGRLVMLGQSASQEATFDAGVVRGKALQILGHANGVTAPEVKQAALRTMCEHAAAGRLTVEYEQIPLERVGEAWERQASSPHVKLILVP